MLGSCCARKPRTAPSQRKHQGARCAATWAGTNILVYVIVVLGHVCYCCFSRVCYCCLRPCMLLLFWAPFHIVGFGIVVLVRVCFCCLRSCLLLLLSFSEEKPRSKVHCIWSKRFMWEYFVQARDGGQRDARVPDPQVEALQAPIARIGFHRSLYTPHILAYIFDNDNV